MIDYLNYLILYSNLSKLKKPVYFDLNLFPKLLLIRLLPKLLLFDSTNVTKRSD